MEQGNIGQLLIPLAFMIAMLVIFWIIVVRPTQGRQRKHQELVQGIMPGDSIITVGGIFGKVVSVRDKTIDLEIAKGTTITLDRRAIRRLQSQEDF
ncbi:MAG: preprotein translocase subunit YajC [Armatimonadetes bacterium]|nr:preprotein translocase subunit YajC [Armatimonadota bacterium]